MKTSHLALIAFAFLQPVPPKTLRLRPRESRHQTKHSTWGSFHLPAMPLRLAQARLHPPPCPLIDSSPFASSPSSPPASRPPASLPQLVSRSGCLHLPRASPARRLLLHKSGFAKMEGGACACRPREACGASFSLGLVGHGVHRIW